MVLLMIILTREEILEDLLEAFLEIGITGGTVIDAHGMGEILSRDVPIFAGLRSLFPGGESNHHLLISVTERDKAAEAISQLKKLCPIEESGSGIAFTLPIEEVCGLAREL